MCTKTLLISLIYFFFLHITVAYSAIPDSLSQISMDSLYEKFNQNSDPKIQKLIANSYLQRAKENGSDLEMANAYRLRAIIYSGTITALSISDSLIILSKDLRENDYPAHSYYSKSVELIYQDRIAEALDLLLVTKEMAKENDNDYLLMKIGRAMGLIYNKIGQKEKSLSVMIESYDSYQKYPEWKTTKAEDYFKSISLLASAYIDLQDFTTALPLLKEGLFYSFDSNKRHYSRFLHYYGMVKSHQGNHKEAIDSLKQGLVYVKEFENTYACGLANLGKAYVSAGKNKEAIQIFEELDTLCIHNDKLLKWALEGYNFLYNYYKSNQNQEKEILYLTKKNNAESVLLKKQVKIANLDLIVEKSEIINQQVDELGSIQLKNNLLLFYAFSISLILIGIVTKKNLFANDTELDISNISPVKLNSEIKAAPIQTGKPISTKNDTDKQYLGKEKIKPLDPEIMRRINSGLHDFEVQNKFTKVGYNLNTLAKELQTNSSYLSKVINATRQMNFTNYINKLRVEYILDKLKTEPIFQRYTIRALAHEAGFNSTQSFTRAFTKYTKKTPTVYIKNLNQAIASGA